MQKMLATTDISLNYDQMVQLELYKINKRIKRLEKVTKTKFQLILIEHENKCCDTYDKMTIVKNKCIKTKHK